MSFLLSMNIELHKMIATPWFWFMITCFAGLGRYILLGLTIRYAGKSDENLSPYDLRRKKLLTFLARGLFTISFIFLTYFLIIILFL